MYQHAHFRAPISRTRRTSSFSFCEAFVDAMSFSYMPSKAWMPSATRLNSCAAVSRFTHHRPLRIRALSISAANFRAAILPVCAVREVVVAQPCA